MDARVYDAPPGRRLAAVLLAGIVLALLLLLLGFQLSLGYDNRVATAETTTRNLAAIFEVRLEATLRRSDADLRALAHEIPLAALSRGALARYARVVDAALKARLFNLQEAVSYRVFAADGGLLYSSGDDGRVPRDIGRQACFGRLRDDADAGLVFCEVAGSAGNTRPTIAIARALRDERGVFRGVVQALIELDNYRRQLESLDLGRQGFIALRRSDGHALVMRCPEATAEDATLAPDHPIALQVATGAEAATVRYTSATDGGQRIVGVQVMSHYPFYLAVGVSREEVLADWRKQALIVGISTLLLLGLVGTLLAREWRMRRREQAMLATLMRSEEQYRMLAEMVPVGLCHINAAGIYTYVNERFLEISGLRRQTLLGKSWLSLFPVDERATIERAWRERDHPGQAYVWEHRIVRPDGRQVDVLGEVRTETDADGRVRGYVVAQTDITPRKEIEAELLAAKRQAERANQEKSRFLTAACHDLRQPIQAINLFRDALARTDLSEEQRRIANLLAVSVHSLGEMLYALLDISKLDSGRLTPQMQLVAIDDLFRSVDAEFSPLALVRGLRFKLYYPQRGMRLRTDSGIVLSVLRNLIDNAFKYTANGGVLVGARRRRGRALIQVFDTGIGIDPDYGEQLFDECFQVNKGDGDRSKGLGLGLSIARRMAQLLGGEVSFRSRPGVGTVFTLDLPLDACPADELIDAVVASAPGVVDEARAERVRGARVALIEDDPMVARSIELALRELAIEVRYFGDAEQALASPDLDDVDFVLSDYTLPGVDGLRLLDALARRLSRPLRAALMTGETAPEPLARMHAAPWCVLIKPVGLADLLAALAGEPQPA